MAFYNNKAGDIRRQLLCTFCSYDNLNPILDLIFNTYQQCDKVFIFLNANNKCEYFLTYSIINNIKKLPNTILLHRKKEYNVLYTINSLNQLIKDENGGILDKSYQVQWELYKNSFIINGDISVKIVPLEFVRIEFN